MNHISSTSATDQEVLATLGERLAALRTERGLTQIEAAERSGLSRPTLSRAERGENATLHTLVRLLRAYGRLGALEDFLRPAEISPMDRLRKRRRATDG
jgi:transcriptional regulator with XRE-family HTH domain